jgi:hypothetical protein
MIRSKSARGSEPLQGDARSAKSFAVLTLIFSTDCSPIDWRHSVQKISRFENVFRDVAGQSLVTGQWSLVTDQITGH